MDDHGMTFRAMGGHRWLHFRSVERSLVTIPTTVFLGSFFWKDNVNQMYSKLVKQRKSHSVQFFLISLIDHDTRLNIHCQLLVSCAAFGSHQSYGTKRVNPA